MGKIAILGGNHDVATCFLTKATERSCGRVALITGPMNQSIWRECKRQDIKILNAYGEPDFEDEVIDHINQLGITTVVLCWWPHIVKKIHKIPGVTVINTHPSYLPHNRGKNPYYWSIVDGTPFGVTIHKVDDGVDTGDILWQFKIEVQPTDTGESLYRSACQNMKYLLLTHLDEILDEDFPDGIKQDDSIATHHYAKDLLENEDLEVDQKLLEFIDDLRARTFYNHYSGRRIKIDGKTYRIHLELVEDYGKEN